MKKILITYPQIVIEQKEVEVSNEQFEDLTEHSSDHEKTNFIWSKMTDQEKTWTHGKNFVLGAVDNGYCGIKPKT